MAALRTVGAAAPGPVTPHRSDNASGQGRVVGSPGNEQHRDFAIDGRAAVVPTRAASKPRRTVPARRSNGRPQHVVDALVASWPRESLMRLAAELRARRAAR